MTRFAIAVEYRPVAPVGVSLLGRDGGGKAHHPADERVVGFAEVVQRRNVAARDHQRVQRRLRVDVVEGEELFVLTDDGRGMWPLAILQNRQSLILAISM